jgi:hypothetical protein
VQRVLAAETAVLVELKTIGVVLLVLERVVVSLLAFGAGQSDLNAHDYAPPKIDPSKTSPQWGHLE